MATTTKVIALADLKLALNTPRLDIFTSKKGNRYATQANGDFVGMLAEDCDTAKPIVAFYMADDETGDTWIFIANGTPRVPDASI